MAWPPLFLLSGVSFWSRYKVLRSGRHQTYRSFGHWRKLLPKDQEYRSPVQQERWMKNGGPQKEGWSNDPIRRIEHQRRRLGLSVAALAKSAGYSRTAVDRLLKEGHGSLELIDALKAAILHMQKEADDVLPVRFTSPSDVKLWLDAESKTISWLAKELGCSRSRVSRIVSGNTAWQRAFGQQVAEVALRLEVGKAGVQNAPLYGSQRRSMS
jgi:AraC-like DNA-binding protein